MAEPRVINLTAHRKVEGLRLDQYLAVQIPECSRTAIRRSIDAGEVLVNGKPAKASYRLRSEDQVHIRLPEPTHELPIPENIPLQILYEDEYLALINKPHDMVVHPAKGHWSGTLVNALQYHFSQLSRANGDYRPGIVHRLDRDTSGVILVAKEEQTHRDLSQLFERRKIFKEYVAITSGVLDRDSDYLEGRIGKHCSDRVKMAVFEDAPEDDEDTKEACTYYEVIERFRGFTYCRLHPKTGRTHQIRVHLANVGCPVLADRIYGGRDALRLSDLLDNLKPESDEILMPRQALHAHRLRFHHPRSGQVIDAVAPLPPEFQRTLAVLRQYRPWR